MPKQLFKQPLGADGSVEADINDDGTASVSASYKDPKSGISVSIVIGGSPKMALDQLKQMIPGVIDDAIIDGLESFYGLK